MTALLFLLFVALMTGLVLWGAGHSLPKRSAIITGLALISWLAYVGLIGYTGILRNSDARPPGMVFLFVPVVIFLIVFAFRKTTTTIPLTALLAIQGFRVIVEIFIHQLWRDGIVPEILTYSGANVDIYVGITAPLIAWLSTHRKWGRSATIIWNLLGLLALANVVIRAVLTAPGPINLIHTDVPNLMFGTFPFMFIPGFFVPLAVVLHLLALKIAKARSSDY